MSNKRNDEISLLSKDKVYTSYYSRACKILPDMRLVSISVGIPDNFKGVICRELNPSISLLNSYKHGNVTDEEYRKQYYIETLSRLDPIKVYEQLKGKVILCYCGSDKFCHRHLVIEWLKDRLGEHIVGGEI